MLELDTQTAAQELNWEICGCKHHQFLLSDTERVEVDITVRDVFANGINLKIQDLWCTSYSGARK